jgi:hypothetical protein
MKFPPPAFLLVENRSLHSCFGHASRTNNTCQALLTVLTLCGATSRRRAFFAPSSDARAASSVIGGLADTPGVEHRVSGCRAPPVAGQQRAPPRPRTPPTRVRTRAARRCCRRRHPRWPRPRVGWRRHDPPWTMPCAGSSHRAWSRVPSTERGDSTRAHAYAWSARVCVQHQHLWAAARVRRYAVRAGVRARCTGCAGCAECVAGVWRRTCSAMRPAAAAASSLRRPRGTCDTPHRDLR